MAALQGLQVGVGEAVCFRFRCRLPRGPALVPGVPAPLPFLPHPNHGYLRPMSTFPPSSPSSDELDAPPGQPPVRLRRAEEADIPTLARLWSDAFPGSASAEERERELTAGDGPWGGLETCRVAEADGAFVGALKSYALRMSLWGEELPVQGLAAVAVAPEARRSGVGTVICRMALEEARERGDLLSVLFPFRVGFYARLDYALAGELHRYRFPPEALPLFEERKRVRRLGAEEAWERVPHCYEALRKGSNGLIRRPEGLWTRALGREGVQVYGVEAENGSSHAAPGFLTGYMVASPRRARRGRGPTLRVRESGALDLGSYRALLGWLSAQRDQWREVVYDALPGEQLHRTLDDPRLLGRERARGLWFPSATLLRGPMARILDLEALVDLLGLSGGDQLADLPIRVLTQLFLSGSLPGEAQNFGGWEPVMGLRDFRLMDTF
jgi:predicted acetyltransferase